MVNFKELRALLSFSIIYIFLILIVLSVIIGIRDDYQKNIKQEENKLIGLQYIKTLHKFSYEIITAQDKPTSIDKLLELQNKNTYLNDNQFTKQIKLIKNSKFIEKDCYAFLGKLNHMHYKVAQKSGLLFSNDRENHFLASLSSHYISKLLISTGITYKILNLNSSNKCFMDSNSQRYIQERKLINLTIAEIGAIIPLLNKDEEVEKHFYNIDDLSSSLCYSKIKYTDSEIYNIKELLNESYELIKLISTKTKLVILDKKDKLENRLAKYNTATIIAIMLITIIFILLYTTYKSKLKKSKELLDSQDNLKYLNDSLKDKIDVEIEKNKEQEEQNFQHSKLIQMGEMISMIAHQWRQPLNAISATSINLSLLSNIGKLDEQKIEQSSVFIQEQCQKMSKTIDTFLNFVKPSKISKTFHLTSAIQNIMQIMEAQLTNSDIKIILDTKQDGVTTVGQEDLLEQVIINILSNARDAFSESKEEDKFIKLTVYTNDDKLATISVEDNAGGIPIEISKKIFNPYFTTKEHSNGTGIGLYMSIGIMKKSFNGNLTYTPLPNGSKFEIICGETNTNE